MSWSQVRLPLPAFYGSRGRIGDDPPAAARQLFRTGRSSPRPSTALPRRSPRGIPRSRAATSGSAIPSSASASFRCWPTPMRARATLEETFESPLLARHPVLARQIELRDPYIDPIHPAADSALARYRAASADAPERPRLERALDDVDHRNRRRPAQRRLRRPPRAPAGRARSSWPLSVLACSCTTCENSICMRRGRSTPYSLCRR